MALVHSNDLLYNHFFGVCGAGGFGLGGGAGLLVGGPPFLSPILTSLINFKS